MRLTKKEIGVLMRLVGLTQDREINCDQCLAQVAEFAERQLQGRSINEGLEAVEQHLAVCPECHEEYEILLRALLEI